MCSAYSLTSETVHAKVVGWKNPLIHITWNMKEKYQWYMKDAYYLLLCLCSSGFYLHHYPCLKSYKDIQSQKNIIHIKCLDMRFNNLSMLISTLYFIFNIFLYQTLQIIPLIIQKFLPRLSKYPPRLVQLTHLEARVLIPPFLLYLSCFMN